MDNFDPFKAQIPRRGTNSKEKERERERERERGGSGLNVDRLLSNHDF